MNMVDRLLKADVVNKLAERPEKKVKMERLSKLFGFDFIITLRAIDPERYADIQKMAVDFTNGSADNIDIYQMQTQTLLAGIADPDLKNKDLLEKFGAVLPGDIIRKLFLAGEIASDRWRGAGDVSIVPGASPAAVSGHETGIRRTAGAVCFHPL